MNSGSSCAPLLLRKYDFVLVITSLSVIMTEETLLSAPVMMALWIPSFFFIELRADFIGGGISGVLKCKLSNVSFSSGTFKVEVLPTVAAIFAVTIVLRFSNSFLGGGREGKFGALFYNMKLMIFKRNTSKVYNSIIKISVGRKYITVVLDTGTGMSELSGLSAVGCGGIARVSWTEVRPRSAYIDLGALYRELFFLPPSHLF